MNKMLALAFAAASLCALVAFRPTGENNPAVGDVAPEIDAAGWLNQIGPAPTLGSMRGQAILIEFWATW